MKKSVKITAALLALMLVSCSFTGCSEKAGAGSNPDAASQPGGTILAENAAGVGEETAEEPAYSLEARQQVSDDLAEHDFGGDTFRMLYQERYADRCRPWQLRHYVLLCGCNYC